MVTNQEAEAKRLFAVYTGGTGNIDRLYGPPKATCRAHILSALWGRKVPKSKAPWGVFRRAMLALYQITGLCAAEEDDQLRNAVPPREPIIERGMHGMAPGEVRYREGGAA